MRELSSGASRSPLANSLARRFALLAAALAAAALLLITVTSWWLVERQHEAAVRILEHKESEFHAATIGRTLHALALRMDEVAGSSILATGLVDSAGKETYLTPYLASIRQVNGIPIQILFADFEGKEISRNGPLAFTPEQLDWLRNQLESGRSDAQVFGAVDHPHLVAARLIVDARTPSAEGAVLYRIALADLGLVPGAHLTWGAEPGAPARPHTNVVPIDAPPIFQQLGLHLVERHPLVPKAGLLAQYALILVVALALAVAVYLAGSRLALTLTAGLRRLEAFSSSVMRHGPGRQRAETSGTSEVAGLARSINHMLDRLNEQHSLLQQETDKLHQLANTIPQLAWIATPEGTIHWYNQRWYAYTGSQPDEDGASLWARTSPEAGARIRAALAAGDAFQLTIPLVGADGVARAFYTSAAPLRGADRRIVQWFGTNTDVSPIERAERAVRDSEERLREGLVAARMAVWDLDPHKGTISFSANAHDVFGCDPQNLGTGWEMLHPEDRDDLRRAIESALLDCGQFEKVVRDDNRETGWLDMRGRVVCDEACATRSVRGIAIDITQRKRAEDALVAANRRKDDFLAMLAHELRNPLAPISTAAEILQRMPTEPRVREISEIIGRQADHMNNLVHDLLDVSRVTRGLITLDRQVVPVDELVSSAVEQVRGLIDARGHRLTQNLHPGAVCVWADRTRMVQVLVNLLNNAAKYTPEGGALTLTTEADAEEVRICVSDNGIGITSDLLPHVFELFIQAERSPDRSQGGLGLGLTLVRNLTELHGGVVTAASGGPGCGSQFTVCLPRAQEADGSAPLPAGAPPSEVDSRGVRIMVVDDNADAALSLAILLESHGFDVETAHSASRALERVSSGTPPQALLLDIGLPDLDGYQLARQLRSLPQTHAALLIAVTGYGQPEDQARSQAAGFDHHMVKPVDSRKLVTLLAGIEAK
jgi:PAS domain S-box-containing protein